MLRTRRSAVQATCRTADLLVRNSLLLLEPLGAALRPVRRDRGVGAEPNVSGVAKAIGNRVAPVTTKILFRHLDAGRRLPPLVFGQGKQMFDPAHQRDLETLGDEIGDPLVALDESLQDRVE